MARAIQGRKTDAVWWEIRPVLTGAEGILGETMLPPGCGKPHSGLKKGVNHVIYQCI